VVKWEYFIFNVTEDDITGIINALNEIGKEGWEIVTCEHGRVEQEGKTRLTATGLVKRPLV
jgi:hypothetical protein